MPSRTAILLAATILLSIALIPVFSVQIPPLADYPNHMARMHILADGGHHPLLREYYAIHWNLLPNLAMDLLIPPLLSWVSIETAGRIFIAVMFALLMGGTLAIHYALHRRWSPWPLIVCFFLYNSVFLWGFLNYLFGLSLALPAIALWLVWRERPATLLVPFFSAIAAVLFFAHLFAFGVWAMVVVSYEGARWWRADPTQRATALHPCWKVLPVLVLPMVLLILSPTFRPTGLDDYPSWMRGSPAPPTFVFSPLNTRLEALKGTVRTQHPWLDRITVVALLGVIGVGLLRKAWRIHPTMYGPIAVTILVALIMPSGIGTTGLVDIRMPIVFVLLLIAVSDWPIMTRRWLIPVGLALTLLFLTRMTMITEHWREADRQYHQFVQALDRLPEGSRLLSALILPDAGSAKERSEADPTPMNTLTCWGIIRRSVFTSNLFAAPGQQPVVLTPPYRPLLTVDEFDVRGLPVPWNRMAEQYDYVAVRKGHRLVRTLPAGFTEFATGETFQIYGTGRSVAAADKAAASRPVNESSSSK